MLQATQWRISPNYSSLNPAVKQTDALKSQTGNDVVRFSGDATLLKRYGIGNIEDVAVNAPHHLNLTAEEKKKLIIESLKTYEHAVKKRLLNEAWLKANPKATNVSGRTFSSTVILENGLKAPAVNSEFSRDDVLCGERSSIVSAINAAIQKLSLNKLQSNPAYLEAARQGIKVKQLVMSGAHRHSGENPVDTSKDSISSPPPCSDCQAWIATEEYFSKDTQIVTLGRDKQGKFTLEIMPVGDLQPLWGNQTVSKTDLPIETLPMVVSPQARGLFTQDLNEARLRTMLQEAKKASDNNPFAEVSKKNGAVAALFSPINEVITASRFDFTARWYNDPAKTVLEKGFSRIRERGASTLPQDNAGVKAIAFYGDYTQPTVNTLGYLAQLERGNGADYVIIARIENNQIQVRTIRDMMPHVYMSARVPREGGKSAQKA